MEKSGQSRLITVRRINWALAGITVVLMAFFPWGYVSRSVRLRYSGAIHLDGVAFCLDPDDQVITQTVLSTGQWEPVQTRVIRDSLHAGDTFIDVGANVGWYTMHAARLVGPTGRVLAFEPEPRAFGLLTRGVAANGFKNVVTEQKALSDRPGKLSLYVNPTNHGNHSVINSFGGKEKIDVPAVTLDDYLRGSEGNLAVVKIDTEGAEGLILQGMKETLDRFPRLTIVMEFNPTWIRKTGVEPEAMLRGLHDRGFSIEAMEYAKAPWPVPAETIPTLIAQMEERQKVDRDDHCDLVLRRTKRQTVP